MAASRKKMGSWGKEWKRDLHFAIFTFFKNVVLYHIHILTIQNIYCSLKYYMYIFFHFNIYYISSLNDAF